MTVLLYPAPLKIVALFEYHDTLLWKQHWLFIACHHQVASLYSWYMTPGGDGFSSSEKVQQSLIIFVQALPLAAGNIDPSEIGYTLTFCSSLSFLEMFPSQ